MPRGSYGIREVTRLLAPLILASRELRRRMEFYRCRGNTALITSRVSTFNRDVLKPGVRPSASSIYADSARNRSNPIPFTSFYPSIRKSTSSVLSLSFSLSLSLSLSLLLPSLSINIYQSRC